MSCLIPPACVFCGHYHRERNEQTDELPSCNAFAAIPDSIFMGEFDHISPFPGDNGLRFMLREADRQDFLELNGVRREMGLLVYQEPQLYRARAPHLHELIPTSTDQSIGTTASFERTNRR